MELLWALRYKLATIQVADSTRVADENFLEFALGEKLRSRSSIAPRTAKKIKDRSSAPVNPPWLAPATAAAFPGSSQPGCCLKLSPPPKSPKAHNSSKLIVARVSPSKSSKV
ncbi:hypothetical protein NDI47_01845 [Microcoleus vaginatus GB1-A2]|uniref:hypothetical protein n=1 Tax=Microcoleus vaginatus TaxID=119532 RepID=UPI00168743C2|nr:hypothetical protein [Microcoleus sp. FACHB-61]